LQDQIRSVISKIQFDPLISGNAIQVFCCVDSVSNVEHGS